MSVTDASEIVIDEDEADYSGLDLDDGAQMTGCTPKQVRLVEGLLMGLNKTRAAKRAGYGGEGVNLRSTASDACRSKKVMALLAWAEANGKGVPDAPGDRDELKRILRRHARSVGDKQMSIKATEALDRMATREVDAYSNDSDPAAFLMQIADMMPEWALQLAKEHNFPFRLTPEQEARMEDRHREIALAYLAKLKTGTQTVTEAAEGQRNSAPEAGADAR